MIEVEIKAYLGNDTKLERFEQQLLLLGAKYLKKINQTDIYFQHPKRDFRVTDEALRIREEDNQFFFTYKGPKIDEKSKTREELEVKIDDKTKLQEILENLGFKLVFMVKKSRKLFSFKEIKMSLDSLEDLGTFLELEIEVKNEEDVEKAVELLLNNLKKLGIPKERLERRSYLELLLEKTRVPDRKV